MDAARRGVERVHLAAPAADEDASAGDAGLRVGLQVAGKREGPFQFQPRHVGRGQARRARVLERVLFVFCPHPVQRGPALD